MKSELHKELGEGSKDPNQAGVGTQQLNMLLLLS